MITSRIWIWNVSILFLVTSAAHAHSGQGAAQSTNIVIGLLLPPEEPEAASLREGATLGVEEANHSAAVRVQLVIRGRAGQWGADGVEAARMVADDGAQGLIAPPDGSASHLVLQVSGRTAVPVVSLCADSSVSRTGVPWMARIVPQTTDEAKALFSGLGSHRWLAVVPEGRAGREAARDLQTAAPASGCSLENVIEAESTFTNAARLCKRILANRPESVCLWLEAGAAGRLAKSLRAAGFAGTLAGPGRLRSAAFAAAAGHAMEGVIVPGPGLDAKAAACRRHFTAAFRRRFGHEPDATAAMSYDAATLLIHVVRTAGGHPAHEAFPLRSSLIGASGVLAFDSQGNRKADLQLYQARGERFMPAETGSDP